MNDVTRIPQGVSLRTISKSVSVLVLINIFNFPSHIRRKLWYNPHLLLLETMVNTYNFLMDYLGGNQTPTNRYTDRQTVLSVSQNVNYTSLYSFICLNFWFLLSLCGIIYSYFCFDSLLFSAFICLTVQFVVQIYV